mgnify:CR=1 FL=1|jgi:hypothetical protein
MTVISAKKFKALCESLEAERSDLTYLKTPRKPRVRVVTKTLKIVPETVKSVYFNAGRYSAGDRDITAIEAYWQYEISEEL